jgi:hypothetical protein
MPAITEVTIFSCGQNKVLIKTAHKKKTIFRHRQVVGGEKKRNTKMGAGLGQKAVYQELICSRKSIGRKSIDCASANEMSGSARRPKSQSVQPIWSRLTVIVDKCKNVASRVSRALVARRCRTCMRLSIPLPSSTTITSNRS